jgi:hypothetical protein
LTHLEQALANARGTTLTPEAWLARIKAPGYDVKRTKWWKAIKQLEAAAHEPPPRPAPKPPPPPPSGALTSVQARMFLADSPRDCLQAPTHMIPVCTADRGYRQWYDAALVGQLRSRFGKVEAWCDCRNPTAYTEVEAMIQEFGLDGGWGQCENQAEWDHAYQYGSRRMVGNITALSDSAKKLVSDQTVLLTAELYRNVMPWMKPDYMGCQNGVGGNCIAVYESATEGASYYPVSRYKAEGFYVSGRDSVYAVGLHPEDWAAL